MVNTTEDINSAILIAQNENMQHSSGLTLKGTILK